MIRRKFLQGLLGLAAAAYCPFVKLYDELAETIGFYVGPSWSRVVQEGDGWKCEARVRSTEPGTVQIDWWSAVHEKGHMISEVLHNTWDDNSHMVWAKAVQAPLGGLPSLHWNGDRLWFETKELT